MKVTKRTVKRTITEDEFIRLKGEKPFKILRQDAKAVNFSLLFGASSRRFSEIALEPSWSLERIEEYIHTKKLEADVTIISEKNPDIEPRLWKYYAVAKHIRSSFFDTYKGLMERIKRNELLAKTQGYIRSYHGAIRRLPILCLSQDADGKLRKGDSMKEISGYINISSNTSIQSDEICTIAIAMTEWATKHSNRAKIIGTVHDSVDFYAERSDIINTLNMMKEIFERPEDWQLGVRLLVDFVISDVSSDTTDHYYKHGYDLEKAEEKLG